MSMTRKEFLGTMMGLAGAAVLAGCGGDDGGGGGSDAGGNIDASGGGSDAAGSGSDGGMDAMVQRSCTENGTNVVIGTNHGHVLVVTKEEVMAGAEKIYDITGTSGHFHMVTVSAANFATLKNDPSAMVVVDSEGGPHTHTITITCA